MTVLSALEAAGLLDPRWHLPLGAGGGRDNLIHHAAVAIALEKPEDRQAWVEPVGLFLFSSTVFRCPGLYYREPSNHGANSYDNTIGASVASVLLDTGHASDIYNWGRTHNWCYNVESPEHFSLPSWYERFAGAPGFIKMAAGKRVWPFGLLAMAGGIEASVDAKNRDTTDVGNKLLMWLWKQALKGRSRYLDLWWGFWEREMEKQYPGGLAEMMGYYFKPVDGKEHPFVTASKGRDFS